ncbi:MAG: ATP-dependent Clp protease ATP-binding subunit ClpC, partial [Myxococcota bacterium]
MRFSSEAQDILKSAQDLADGADQSLTSGHILLGMLTCSNRAGTVLLELGVDADKVLAALSAVKRANRRLEEPEELLAKIEERMVDAARHSGSAMITSLHLLLALTREKPTIAYQAFAYVGIPPVHVRTQVLSRINGPVPRSVSRHRDSQRNDSLFDREPQRAVAFAEPEPAPEPKLAPLGDPAAVRTSMAQARVNEAARDTPAADARGQRQPGGITDANDPDAMGDLPDPGAAWLLDPEDFPVLTALGRNLSADAARGLIDPVVGRERVIDTIIDVLNKRRSNNPCLVGEPGVGKTAIVEGLARAIRERGDHLTVLRDRIIISLDVGSLVAGTELRGSFSRRMAKLKEEVRESEGRVIVFIDEIHTLVGAGSGEGALDAANDLKAALARGEFPCIGATTPKEYHRHIEKDAALERRFQPIEVDEPSEEDALTIVKGVIEHYEDHHGVMYEPEALEAAVRMSRRYIVDRRLPDKAFNLVDTAAARVVRHGKEVVEVADIASVVAEMTQIPLDRLLMTDVERILSLRDFMAKRIIGHGEVLDQVSEVIQRNSAGFASHRPIGSFLFLGPSGVGKTETAKVLADFLFCSPDAMTRFDMSEFMERHAVSRLLGAAPGYVGHEEAGALTAALNRRPYQIILFDEIEKAHGDLLNVLLQVLDEGQVTDAKGRVLNLANTVIIMTSNLGAEVLNGRSKKRIGFGGDGEEADGLSSADIDAVLKSARKAVPPEVWGRIDEKCVFGTLSRRDIQKIARLLIKESSKRLNAERSISYEATVEVIEYLIDSGGYDQALGARPMRRAVQRHCETAIARAVL